MNGISTVNAICTDPEAIETLEPENVQIVCSSGDRDQYIVDNPPTNHMVTVECDSILLFPIITRSPICDRQE